MPPGGRRRPSVPPAARAATGAARALLCPAAAASRPARTRPAVLRGRPAEQQPGQPPYRGGGTRPAAACPPGPLRLHQQGVPFAGPLCVVVDGLHDALLNTHGLLPGRRRDWRRAEPPRMAGSGAAAAAPTGPGGRAGRLPALGSCAGAQHGSPVGALLRDDGLSVRHPRALNVLLRERPPQGFGGASRWPARPPSRKRTAPAPPRPLRPSVSSASSWL